MSSLKCPTPQDIKFHLAQCDKGDYNQMKSIPIGKQETTQIPSILEVSFIGIDLTTEPAASAVLTTSWNWELMLATNRNSKLSTFLWVPGTQGPWS